MRKIKCFLCGSNDVNKILECKDYRFNLSKDVFELVQCKKCGLIYINPMPVADELKKYYPENYYNQGTLSNKIIRIYSILMEKIKVYEISYYKNSGKILDVGCGTGDFLFSFNKNKWDRYGVDVSKEACEIAKSKLGGNIYNNDLIKCKFPEKYFDVITLNHVLEHFEDPLIEMKEIFRILKDDGILFIRVPNIESIQFRMTREYWLHLDVPRHLFFYSKKTLEKLLNKAKFETIKISYPFLEYPLDILHSIIRKYNQKNYNKLRNIVLYLFSPLLFMSKIIRSMRGTVQFICKKKG